MTPIGETTMHRGWHIHVKQFLEYPKIASPGKGSSIAYREDECGIRERSRPANFATIRHMTLDLLQRTKTEKQERVRVQ